jgi:hypothetical protein
MFNILPKEEIIKGIRYDTGSEHSRLLAYSEAVEGKEDKLLLQGKNGRLFLAIQKPKKYSKFNDDSVNLIPVNKEEAIKLFSDMAERLLPEKVFDELIIA